jgi:hypothetical protein
MSNSTPPPSPIYSPDGTHLWDGGAWRPVTVGVGPTASSVSDRTARFSTWQRVMLVFGLVGVAAAVTLALLPLPPISWPMGGFATCGPGSSPDSAIMIKLDPQSVNQGNQGTAVGVQQTLVNYCTAAANDRFWLCLVTVLAPIAIIVVGDWVLRIFRRSSPITR